jgi:hypothetical protein
VGATVDLTFDPEREQNELTEYLGERFELERLWRYEEQLEAEFADCGDQDEFYRTSFPTNRRCTTSCQSGACSDTSPATRCSTTRCFMDARILSYTGPSRPTRSSRRRPGVR